MSALDPTRTAYGPDGGGRKREQRLASALARFHDLQAKGRGIAVDAFCQHYPDLAPELAMELRAWLEVQGWLDNPLPATPVPPPKPEPPPESLSGFPIIREIGSGGMGRVYLALDARLDRQVAIKTLAGPYIYDPGIRQRFLEEAKALAAVNHPHVVRIYQLGSPAETPHFVMEYLDGRPLTMALQGLPLAEKLPVLLKVFRAVAFLHERGMVHRDLKPGNILAGADREPKVLDFGLIRRSNATGPLTRPGQIMGTPDYFSPEQARGEPLDPRSDVFSLGVILYELLTGRLPFEESRLARPGAPQEPVWPRRINPSLPVALEAICLTALDEDPAGRYRNAGELAGDLERFLQGEPVAARPPAFARHLAGGVSRHVAELEGWARDRLINGFEFDRLRRFYDRLLDREDAWIMEARRLTLSQVGLYLGGWTAAAGALLLVLFQFDQWPAALRVLVPAAATAGLLAAGRRLWRRGLPRPGIAFLLTAALMTSLVLLSGLVETGWAAGWTRQREELEFFRSWLDFPRVSNAQFWWAMILTLPVWFGLRRFTGAAVFSLGFSVYLLLSWLAMLLCLGLLDWLELDRGRFFFWLLPLAALYFFAGYRLERKSLAGDSRFFYPPGVLLTYLAGSGLALFHEPWARLLGEWLPWTRGQADYLFMFNALVYLLLAILCDRLPSAQLSTAAKAFRFVLAGHVLIPLYLLALAAMDRWQSEPANAALRTEARIFEILLPAAAAGFILLSIPRQMKNYLATGFLFLAAGLIRLQQDLFRGRPELPVMLLGAGVLIMILASRHGRLLFPLPKAWRLFLEKKAFSLKKSPAPGADTDEG